MRIKIKHMPASMTQISGTCAIDAAGNVIIIKNKIKGVAKAPKTQYKGISKDNNNISVNELYCCWE